MKITTKGQVAIPIEIRKKTGLLSNTEVKCEIVNGKVYIEKTEGAPKAAVIAGTKGRATVKMTTDEIMCLTRG